MKKEIGIIMNGVTGRMGTNQHLIRSILAIRKQGGLAVGQDTVLPRPVLVGRNEGKLRFLAETYGVEEFTTDLDACLKNPENLIYFDAQTTDRRAAAVRQALPYGKAIYCEKPTASNLAEALSLHRDVAAAGLKNGVVQDKLWLPGLLKLKLLIDTGFFGRIHSVRGEFGYWVFDGQYQDCQRPSWNYRKQDGGGIIIDMLCHFQYLIENLFGTIKALSCLGATHVAQRWDEQHRPYDCTADDAAYATFELTDGCVCHFNASWAVRVRRDDLLTLQVDGTKGSAVAGLRSCVIQPQATTPKAVWNPDVDQPISFFDAWEAMPDTAHYDNAFKVQWELFLKHVLNDEPFPWTLRAGARGVQIAELALESWAQRRWLDVASVE